MTDVVENGRPEGGGRPRAAVVVAVVAVLAVAAVGARVLTTRDRDPSAQPAPATSSAAPRSPSPHPDDPDAPPEGDLPPAEAGFVLSTHEVRGSAVIVDGDGLPWVVDLATGEQERIPGVTNVFSALRVGSAVALLGSPDVQPGIGYVSAPLWVVRADGDVRQIARDVSYAVPDAEETGLWVVRNRPNDVTAQHVRLDGRALGAPVRLPDGPHSLVRETPAGLLLSAGGEGGVLVWDPRRRAPVHTVGGVYLMGATARRVVWTERECSTRCTLTWGDLPEFLDGDQDGSCRCAAFDAAVEAPGVTSALSPDGRWLAVEVSDNNQYVVVCDIDGRTCTTLAYGWSSEHMQLAWTADGRSLLLTTGPRLDRLGVWQPGWETVKVIPGEHTAVAVAAYGPG